MDESTIKYEASLTNCVAQTSESFGITSRLPYPSCDCTETELYRLEVNYNSMLEHYDTNEFCALNFNQPYHKVFLEPCDQGGENYLKSDIGIDSLHVALRSFYFVMCNFYSPDKLSELVFRFDSPAQIVNKFNKCLLFECILNGDKVVKFHSNYTLSHIRLIAAHFQFKFSFKLARVRVKFDTKNFGKQEVYCSYNCSEEFKGCVMEYPSTIWGFVLSPEFRNLNLFLDHAVVTNGQISCSWLDKYNQNSERWHKTFISPKQLKFPSGAKALNWFERVKESAINELFSLEQQIDNQDSFDYKRLA